MCASVGGGGGVSTRRIVKIDIDILSHKLTKEQMQSETETFNASLTFALFLRLPR